MKQISLLLNQNVNIDVFDVKPGHQCTFCDSKLCEEGLEIFDNLENLKQPLSNEIIFIQLIWTPFLLWKVWKNIPIQLITEN